MNTCVPKLKGRLRSERGSLELIQNAIVLAAIGIGLASAYLGFVPTQSIVAGRDKCIAQAVSIDPVGREGIAECDVDQPPTL